MSDLSATKVCPHCAETIKVAAKACPRCRSRLERARLTVTEWLQQRVIPLLFIGAILLASWWLRDVSGQGHSFESYRDRIVVGETAMFYGRSECTNSIATVGYLRNESPYAWKDLQLEVQYFDRSNRLVDARTETLNFQVLPAGVTEVFRIRAAAVADESAYASHKVFVRTAKDARTLLSGGD